ncbi:MAG TPA: hypothetical protein IAC24_03345 [Candidatus Onthousia faecigallinarum]|nr:hypothetical protein [Candidatus Onthousia faecigallinarum]
MKKKKIVILVVLLLILILLIVLLKTVSLGYEVEYTIYDEETGSQTVALGVPKLSFFKKENGNHYSYKSIRGQKVLEQEMESFLDTLEEISCNDHTYYYDQENDFTILKATVVNHFLYHTISYEVRYGNYCSNQNLSEISSILGGLKRYHTLNGDPSAVDQTHPYFVVTFLDGGDGDTYEMKAELHAYYVDLTKEGERKELERSKGTFEIEDGELIFTRDEILEKSDDITIPEVSIFSVKDGELTLIDNYFREYEENVVLK